MEEFRDIKGYEGKYQVSNLGRVKSLKDKYGNYREKILRTDENKNGYLNVKLYREGKRKSYRVHRLVAEAFIDNPNNYQIINHKDENPANNNFENLEWCTQKYNVNYGTALQRRIVNTDWKKRVENTDYKVISIKRVENTDWKELARKLSKTVLQYTKDGEFVREWESTAECGRNGFYSSNVVSCCNGKLKYYKGFIWKYKEE